MSHRIHLCLVSADDPSRVQVCARAGHWVWPIVPAATRSRLPLIGAQYLASAAPRHVPCCVTYPSAGEAASLDWLGVYAVDRTSLLTDCAWIEWSALDAHSAVVPYQADAMNWYRAGLCGQRAIGTFESLNALAAVRQWVQEQCDGDNDDDSGGALRRPRPRLAGTWEPFRLTAHEAVIRFDATPAPVYFKATHVRPFRDACVTQAIERTAPGWGPRTLGWDERRGWWLIDHMPGLSFGARWDAATASRAIEAVRTLQHTLRSHAKALVTAGATAIDEQFVETTRRELEVLAAARHESWPSRELEEGFTALLALMREREDGATWNHGDLADQNVAVTNEGIRFIDQEAAAIGPSVLSVTKLARMCETATKTTGWFDRCLHALADEPPWRASNLTALETLGTLARKAAAVATFGLRTASLRHRQRFGEFSPNLDAFIVRAAHQTAAIIRDADTDGSGLAAGLAAPARGSGLARR
jgi:hypothetical protein